MTLQLCGYYRSSAAYRVRIALGLKELAYDYVPVNIMPGVDEQRGEAYLAVNPQGRVPFFQDEKIAIGQSPAILEYLDEAYPKVPLLPTDLAARALVRQLASLIGCDIHPLNNLSVLQTLKQSFGANDAAVNRWYHRWITEGFTAFEQLVGRTAGVYCFGDTPSMADVYLVPQVWNARRFNVPLEEFPNIVRIDAACNELEAFINAAPENQPDAPKA